jgi:hypothetical protein
VCFSGPLYRRDSILGNLSESLPAGKSGGPLVDFLFHMTHVTHMNHKRSESLYFLSESLPDGKSEGPLVDFLFHVTHKNHMNHKRIFISLVNYSLIFAILK